MTGSDFDLVFFEKKVSELNPAAPIIKISCKTGENLESWISWIVKNIKK